ncbi:hypothetical protein BDC45DRAFT_529317 [Circinella umbellata]|nr:hypothetical protein BDC45DRAFT_529317 [Circinella umbellata]
MGCCFSQTDKTTVYEVTLDANGVARRCPTGKGTHFIHVNQDYETHLEEKKYDIIQQPDKENNINNNPISKPTQAHQQTRFPFLPANRMNANTRIAPSPVNDDDDNHEKRTAFS